MFSCFYDPKNSQDKKQRREKTAEREDGQGKTTFSRPAT
jgi:hypothetical protein